MVKKLPANVEDTRDTGSIPGLERSPEVGNGNPLQYFCLENSMDRGTWQATGFVSSSTRWKNCSKSGGNKWHSQNSYLVV